MSRVLAEIEAKKIVDCLPAKRNGRITEHRERRNIGRMHTLARNIFSIVLHNRYVTTDDICEMLGNPDRRRVQEVLSLLNSIGYCVVKTSNKKALGLGDIGSLVDYMIRNEPVTKKQLIEKLNIKRRRIEAVLCIMIAIGRYIQMGNYLFCVHRDNFPPIRKKL